MPQSRYLPPLARRDEYRLVDMMSDSLIGIFTETDVSTTISASHRENVIFKQIFIHYE